MTTPTFEIYHSIATPPLQAERRAHVAGLALSGAAIVLIALDIAARLLGVAAALQATGQPGLPSRLLVPIALFEAACLVLYAVPRTAPLGAILLTGVLGGAGATHLWLASPLLTRTLLPLYIAALAWGALWFRDARVRALFRPPAALPIVHH